MSCQEVIDRYVTTKKGRYLHSFTVIGESGPANVPKDVHVRFYGCTISTLTLNGNNNIFIEGGTCQTVTATTSLLSARGTSFSGEVSLDHSKADLYAITATGAWRVKGRSYLRADDSTFSGSDIAGDFKEGSQGRLTRCTFSGHGTCAIKADGGSFVLLSKCPSIQGVKALWALDRSVIQAIECALVQGTATYALQVETYARIETLNCATVKGQVQAVNGDTYGFVLCNKCETIIGTSDSAVFLNNHAGVEIRTFQTIRGQGNSAIRGANLNSVFVLGGALVKSDGKDGIELLNGGHGHIVSVQTITGTGRDGIHLDQTSELYVNDVITIEGKGAHGVYVGNQSLLQLHEVATVKGQAGSGAKLDTNARLSAFFVENFIGLAADGLTLGTGTYASVQGAAAITGQAAHGVRMGSSARLILSKCEAVTGQAGDGINAGSGCQITVSKGTTVTGQAGNGIVAGTGSTVNVVGQESVTGQAGDGIVATGSLVKLRKVSAVTGQSGVGVNLTNSDLDAVLCPAISGQASEGVTATGEGADKTRLRFDRCTVIGTATGLTATQVLVESRGTTFTGPTAIQTSNCHVRSVRDTFSGNAVFEDSIYEEWNSTVSGTFTMSGGAGFGARGSMSSSFFDDAAFLSVAASLGGTALSNAFMNLTGGSATISGLGGVLSLGAGSPSAGITFVEITTALVLSKDQVGDQLQLASGVMSLSAITKITADAPLYDFT